MFQQQCNFFWLSWYSSIHKQYYLAQLPFIRKKGLAALFVQDSGWLLIGID